MDKYPEYQFKCGCLVSRSEYKNNKSYGIIQCPDCGKGVKKVTCLCSKCGEKYYLKQFRLKLMICPCCRVDALLSKDEKARKAKKKIDCEGHSDCLNKNSITDTIFNCLGCKDYKYNRAWRFK